jgi:hypothetical protein
LENGEKEARDYKVTELKFKPKPRNEKFNINDKELRMLEELEKREENHI